MAKYCPKCCDEFKNNLDVCPVDKVKLMNKPCKKDGEVYVDIYAAKGEIEAERIIAFLADDNIVPRELPEGMAQLPASDIRYVLTVLEQDAKRARRLIEDARKDGVISKDGDFL
jgi:hypothetical protein